MIKWHQFDQGLTLSDLTELNDVIFQHADAETCYLIFETKSNSKSGNTCNFGLLISTRSEFLLLASVFDGFKPTLVDSIMHLNSKPNKGPIYFKTYDHRVCCVNDADDNMLELALSFS